MCVRVIRKAFINKTWKRAFVPPISAARTVDPIASPTVSQDEAIYDIHRRDMTIVA